MGVLYCKRERETHRDQGLGHAGQHGWPQRVQKDLVLRDGQDQQGGGVLGAQVQQQRGQTAATLGEREINTGLSVCVCVYVGLCMCVWPCLCVCVCLGVYLNSITLYLNT